MRPTVPFVLFVLALAGCGDDDDKDGDGRVTSTTVEASTTTTDEPTTTTAPATTTTCPPPASPEPELLARVDLDGDGTDEVWRTVGSGASVEIVELRQVGGCVELAVTIGGLPAQFAVGGTVTHLDAVRCTDGTVVATSVTSDDGLTYAGTETTYELRDGKLVATGEAPVTVGPAGLPEAALFAC